MSISNRKTSADSYQVLSERDHIRKRVGMYAGQIAPHAANEYVYDHALKKMVKRVVTYIPALVKIFSEILDNAIDEYKRHPDILSSIRVELASGEITISDNGAGIPVELHSVTNKYIPETVFTNLRAGSNFNDDEERMTIGTNGVGSSIAVILSSSFRVETCDGKNRFVQEYYDGLLDKTEPKIKPYAIHGTRVTFTPDFEYFGIDSLDKDHLDKMMKRVVDVAGCNPDVKFYINGERVLFRSFSDYVATYQDDFIYEGNNDWKVAIACSDADQFEQISFVNAVETYNGGTHVDYVFLQVAAKLRELFKKKHKVDITPGMLKNHMRLFIACDIDKPKFNSQTKDCMVSEVKNFKTSFEVTDKFARKIMDSPIVQSVLDWVLAKEDAARRAELRKLNKDTDKVNPRSIEKLNDASKKGDRSECMIFLSEGDSAATTIKSACKAYKDPTLIGSYPLRGKPLNVCGIDTKRLVANQVFSDMMVAVGLKMGEKVENVSQLRYGKIVLLTDADFDGFHISGLLLNMFKEYWPELLKLGCVYRFVTPTVKVFLKKETLMFMTETDFLNWKKENDGKVQYTSKYYKGLGSSKTNEFMEYVKNMDQHLIPIRYEDVQDFDSLDLAFNHSRADDRKQWLSIA